MENPIYFLGYLKLQMFSARDLVLNKNKRF